MRSLLYALFLLVVLAGSVLLLRSIEPRDAGPRHREPVVESLAPSPIATGRGAGDAATPAELLAVGAELLNLWHVREATDVFERATAADSTRYEVWVRLVECYAHPLICREDDARAAWRRAADNAPAAQDTVFLAGLRNLYLHRDYAAAAGDFTSARKTESRGASGASGADAAYYLALAHYLAGRLDEADSDLEDLLTEDDTVGRVVELSILVTVARGDIDRASERARELARMYSEEPFPYVLLAQIETLRGAPEAAVEFCNNALVLDPRYIPAIVTRANLYVTAGSMEPARVSYEKLLLFDDLILQSIGQEGIAFVDFASGDFRGGVDAMDEAIRHAIMAGSVRRGLSYAASLVSYLCELGQADEAEGVIERWVTGFGEVPVRLARARIDVLRGDIPSVHQSLIEMKTNSDWLIWSRALSMDYTELAALTHVAAGQHRDALELLRSDDGRETGVAAGVAERRAFLEGYASFESGDAEAARTAFIRAHHHLFGVEFPYRGDPVLGVQSLFFIAESAIASGDEAGARTYYSKFLEYWAEAGWDLPAVARARAKLESLGPDPGAGGER